MIASDTYAAVNALTDCLRALWAGDDAGLISREATRVLDTLSALNSDEDSKGESERRSRGWRDIRTHDSRRAARELVLRSYRSVLSPLAGIESESGQAMSSGEIAFSWSALHDLFVALGRTGAAFCDTAGGVEQYETDYVLCLTRTSPPVRPGYDCVCSSFVTEDCPSLFPYGPCSLGLFTGGRSVCLAASPVDLLRPPSLHSLRYVSVYTKRSLSLPRPALRRPLGLSELFGSSMCGCLLLLYRSLGVAPLSSSPSGYVSSPAVSAFRPVANSDIAIPESGALGSALSNSALVVSGAFLDMVRDHVLSGGE